MIFYLGCTFFS